jgi:hypothetical protein
MKLPRAVMNDLLAVYLAGAASPETRALVEQCAREDAEFAAAMRRAAELTIKPPAPPAPDGELRSLKMTRQFVFLRSLFMGVAIFFTLLPFSFVFEPGKGLTWLVWDRSEGLGAAFLSVGAASWVAWWLMRREVRKAGL